MMVRNSDKSRDGATFSTTLPLTTVMSCHTETKVIVQNKIINLFKCRYLDIKLACMWGTRTFSVLCEEGSVAIKLPHKWMTINQITILN